MERSAPYTHTSRIKGSAKTEETEEGGQSGTSVVRAETSSASPTTKSGRKKHRGSGKGPAEAEQDQPLSLPLVYEQREAEDKKE